MKNRPLAAIVSAGLIAGVLDISSAVVLSIVYGGTPTRMLQGIASGAIGRDAARAGGAATALLGLSFHFLIAFTAAALYYAASRKLPILVERPYVFGPLYGIAVWAFMQFVVIPLSQIVRRPFNPTSAAIQIVIHIFLVGLTIALVLRRFMVTAPPLQSDTARSFHPAG